MGRAGGPGRGKPQFSHAAKGGDMAVEVGGAGRDGMLRERPDCGEQATWELWILPFDAVRSHSRT